jgi:hypothetical protein
VFLFSKQKLLLKIKEISVSTIEPSSIGDARNKGTILLRFKIDETQIAVMSTHLDSDKCNSIKRAEVI